MTASAKILHHPASLKRAFESAGVHPALASWVSAAVPSDVDIRAGLRQLRARSRSSAQNDDHMSYYLRLVEANVIGHQGIVIQARPKLLSGGYDKSTAARIEAVFGEQCERGAWDVTGTLSRLAFDRLGVRTVAMDGEILIRIHEADPDLPTGWGVEIIDAEALDLDYNAELPNGNLIRMGVEMTPRRRPVAYHVFREPVTGWGGYTASTQRERIPAADILHVYLPEWVWGTRGIPWAHASLRRMAMLSGYEEAAITAARVASAKAAAYVTTQDYTPGSSPSGQTLEDGRFVQDLEPGAIEQVPYGWDLKTLDWQWPNTDHGTFVKACLRGIASGLGVSYNALANDLEGVNYSSLRQGALSERELWMLLQSWWIDWVSRPLYRRWLSWAVRSGQLTRANGNPLPAERLAALSHASFQGRRWPWVDPVKDMDANRLAVELRTKSISEIIRESGRDPEEVWTELASDLETLKAADLALASQAPPAPPPATTAPRRAGAASAPDEADDDSPEPAASDDDAPED
jgi:lambda family phage portal protein